VFKQKFIKINHKCLCVAAKNAKIIHTAVFINLVINKLPEIPIRVRPRPQPFVYERSAVRPRSQNIICGSQSASEAVHKPHMCCQLLQLRACCCCCCCLQSSRSHNKCDDVARDRQRLRRRLRVKYRDQRSLPCLAGQLYVYAVAAARPDSVSSIQPTTRKPEHA